jgi:hypothetical protein
MKTIFVINAHSFVDLITNSSSELFVCDTKKSVSAVKEILVKLIDMHNELESDEARTCSFGGVFKDPQPAKYHFCYWKANEKVREQFEYYSEYGNPFNRSRYGGGWSSEDRNPEVKALRTAEQELNKQFGVHEQGLYEKNKEEYERRRKLLWEAESKLWADYRARQAKSEFDLFVEMLKQNEFSDKLIATAKADFKKHLDEHKKKPQMWLGLGNFSNKKVREAAETFGMIRGYGIEVKPGSILVHSADDNSVPCALMESVSAYLNADRYHLG